MKLWCLQDNLAEGLALVGRAVPTKSSLAVLTNVLLATDGGRLKLVANNLEMAISHWIGAQVEQEGSITLPARLLNEYVSLLERGQKIELSIAPGSKRVHLVCGRYEANIAGIDADDFPLPPTVEGGTGFTLSAVVLKQAIDQVVLAAATDDSRPVLAGVLVLVNDGQLTLAAADGFRLAVRTLALGDGQEQKLNVIIPGRTLRELARILPSDEDSQVEVAATPGQNQVLFRLETVEIVSRLIEGQFPDYQRIIPGEARTTAVLSTQEFLKATRAAAVFARDNSNIVRLNLAPAEAELVPGKLTVSGTAPEMGDNTSEVDASIEGEGQEVAFNGQYLKEALDVMGSQQVTFQLTSSTSPGILRPAGSEAANYMHVVMPMHVAR